MGLWCVTALSKTIVFRGPYCRGLRWCVLLGGEGIRELMCRDWGCGVGDCCVGVYWVEAIVLGAMRLGGRRVEVRCVEAIVWGMWCWRLRRGEGICE